MKHKATRRPALPTKSPAQDASGGKHRKNEDNPSEGNLPLERITRALWQPVDIASLVFFRIAFGLIMVWEVYRYFAMDRVRRYYIQPEFFFSYFGFDWVKPWPGDGMHLHFVVLGLLGLFIALGLFYRVSAVLFFLGFTYVF